jgi:hypothetical protein
MNTAFLNWIGAPVRAVNLHHSMLPACGAHLIG